MAKNDDIEKLLNNLPYFIRQIIYNHSNRENLLEIILDFGRRPEAHFTKGSEYVSREIISWQDLDFFF